MRWLSPHEVALALPAAAEGSSEITVGGHSIVISGLVPEAAARLGDDDPVAGYVFFLTDDVPYEDALSITLTDSALRTLDRAWLGGAYTTGAWREPAIDGPGRISFRFIDEKRWMVTILPRPAGRITLPREPRGAHRSFGMASDFVLSTT